MRAYNANKEKRQIKDNEANKTVRCHFMGSVKERATISYLLHQDGARPSGRREVVRIQMEE